MRTETDGAAKRREKHFCERICRVSMEILWGEWIRCKIDRRAECVCVACEHFGVRDFASDKKFRPASVYISLNKNETKVVSDGGGERGQGHKVAENSRLKRTVRKRERVRRRREIIMREKKIIAFSPYLL